MSSGNPPLTPTEKIKKPFMLLCKWVIEVWQWKSAESIIKSFKRCYITNAMDGTDGDMLWKSEDNEAEVQGS